MTGRQRIDIIMNPAAGVRRRDLYDAVIRRLRDEGAAIRCMETQGPGHATVLARKAAEEGEADVIVAAGGDGTINEVASGLLGCPVPLGILPLGTANVLSIEIGQKIQAEAVADTLLYGEANLIGTGAVDGEIFLLMVGIGFDGSVVHAINPGVKRRLGKFAFVWEGLKTWARGPGRDVALWIDGVREQAAWVLVTNARHYAGGYTLSRTTDVSAPGLDVFLFRKPGRFAFAIYFLGLAFGRVAAMPGVDLVHGRELRVEARPGLQMEVDGDAVEATASVIQVGEQILRLVVPRS